MNAAFKEMSDDKFDIKWYDIAMHPINPKLFNVYGEAQRRIGEIITDESGEVVYVDEHNHKNYVTQFRLVFPIDCANKADIGCMLQFSKEYAKLQTKMTPEDIEKNFINPKFMEKAFTFFSDGGALVSIQEYDGFDLSKLDLDDVQIDLLRNLKPEGQS